MRAAASRTFCTAGSSSPIRMPMMAITTNNSISVNAVRGVRGAWRPIPFDKKETARGLARNGGAPEGRFDTDRIVETESQQEPV